MFVDVLRKVNIVSYERFFNIDAAYTEFLNKLMKVINEIAPRKKIRIKNNNQDWFERGVADLTCVKSATPLSGKEFPLSGKNCS